MDENVIFFVFYQKNQIIIELIYFLEYVKIKHYGRKCFQDNDMQASQMTNVFGAAEVANVMVSSEMSNDDILGEPVPYNQIESMRQFCNQVLKLTVRVSSCLLHSLNYYFFLLLIQHC